MAWTIALSDADISTLTTAYTMAAGSEGRMSASFTNRSTSATATVQLWVVPSGETRGNEHLKEAGTTLGFAGTPQANLERFFVVPAGAVVFVQASTANVSCQVQGDVVAATGNSAVTDGLSGVVYGTNIASYGGVASLKKDENGLVTFAFGFQATGSPGAPQLTLPSGYRPAVPVAVCGTIVLSSVYNPFYCLVGTNGQISGVAMPTATAPLLQIASIVFIDGSFYT